MHHHQHDTGALLHKSGLKRTRALCATLDFLSIHSEPVTAAMIIDHLHQEHILANKTTVYRQLDQLKKNGILLELDFGDLQKRYELVCDDHHHHLICTKCGRVLDIRLRQELDEEEARIARETGFSIERHALEFFGRCPACQSA
jgi:Fur family ferric uptake transcriptional regulator